MLLWHHIKVFIHLQAINKAFILHCCFILFHIDKNIFTLDLVQKRIIHKNYWLKFISMIRKYNRNITFFSTSNITDPFKLLNVCHKEKYEGEADMIRRYFYCCTSPIHSVPQNVISLCFFSFVFLFGLLRRLPHGIFLQGNFTGNNWLPRRVETTSP